MSKYAIAGLGVTPQGVIPGTSAEKLAWDAIELALSDSGLERRKKERTPYVVAVVALEEGPEITTNIVDTDIAQVEIGMPVRIVISNRGEHKIHQASARV